MNVDPIPIWPFVLAAAMLLCIVIWLVGRDKGPPR